MHCRLTRPVVGQGLALWAVSFPDRMRPVFGRSLADLFSFARFQLLDRNASVSICRASRSEERPNCIRRGLAIWNLSFSISKVRSWTTSFAACSSAVAAANSF
jgi:hypothetical protein